MRPINYQIENAMGLLSPADVVVGAVLLLSLTHVWLKVRPLLKARHQPA
jgi:hypothetical protein